MCAAHFSFLFTYVEYMKRRCLCLESPDCPEDEVFMPCGNHCENTCDNVVNNGNKERPCLKICRIPGACGCKEGFARIAGECVKEEECFDDNTDTPPG